MPKQFINENVNIDICPLRAEIRGTEDITIGDLHANPIKLLYFLVRHGICTIPDNQYTRLVEIYKTPQQHLTKEVLEEYNTIVTQMKVINQNVLVRLIGDELGDRGSNDYFVLKILQKLKKDEAKVEILLSNHGMEFIEAYERFVERSNTFTTTLLDPLLHAPSLKALASLIERKLISTKEVFEIIDACYKPTLKIIGYSLDREKPGITIYSHAGIGLQSIKALAKKFNVAYHDETELELAKTIDIINRRFAEEVRNNRVHTLLNSNEMFKGYCNGIEFSDENALEYLMWNRNYDALERPSEHKGYSLYFAHGHDKNEATRDNIFVLDTDLGKAKHWHQANYACLITDELQLAQILQHRNSKKSFNEAKSTFFREMQLFAQLSKKLTAKERQAAKKFHQSLEQAGSVYFQNPTKSSYLQFKTTCTKLIDNARHVFDSTCSLKQLLGNIALAILGLGIFYLAAICYNKATTGRFLFFAPYTAKQIDAIESALSQPELAPGITSM